MPITGFVINDPGEIDSVMQRHDHFHPAQLFIYYSTS